MALGGCIKDRRRVGIVGCPDRLDVSGASLRLIREGVARNFVDSKNGQESLRFLRAEDAPIVESVRSELRSVIASLSRDFQLVSPWDPYSVEVAHVGNELGEVMNEMIRESPDESFCFLNEGRLREKAQIIRKGFLDGDSRRRVTYAVKANPKRRIIQILMEEGIRGFDCASLGEIDLVQRESRDAEVYFNNPVKSLSQVRESWEKGVRYYSVQNREEIEKVMEARLDHGDPANIAVRLSTSNSGAVINLSDKFGASIASSRELLRMVKEVPGLTRGLAIHTGSQNHDPGMFRRGIELMAGLARQEGAVESLNVGGGIPVNYHPGENYDCEAYLRVISQAIHDQIRGVMAEGESSDPRIILELGRAMVAESVDLAIPILSSDTREGKKCLYINDGVFTSFSDSPVHGWEYHFEAIRKDGRPVPTGREPYLVFGRTCDSGDQLGTVLLPEGLASGDWLWVRNAGAYLDSQSTFFNGLMPPTYVSYNI